MAKRMVIKRISMRRVNNRFILTGLIGEILVININITSQDQANAQRSGRGGEYRNDPQREVEGGYIQSAYEVSDGAP